MCKGSQDSIQPKIHDIYKIVFNIPDEQGVTEEEENPEEEEAAGENDRLQEFHPSVSGCGLCGGWVEVFKSYPEWLYELWQGLKSWEGDLKTGEDLENLDQHIRSVSTRMSGLKQAGELPHRQALLAIGEAWEHMRRLEPQNYAPLPYELRILSSRVEPLSYREVRRKEIRKMKKGQIDEKEIVKEISTYINNQHKKKAQGEYFFRMETDIHHMAVRVKTTAKKFEIIVVETEYLGIEYVNSFEDLEVVFSKDLYKKDDASTCGPVEFIIYERE